MANPRVMNMSEETKRTADNFVELINELFETTEGLSQTPRPMNEGEWLNISKNLMKLHQFKDRFMTNVVVVEQVQRHQRGRVLNRKKKTREEKLTDTDMMTCPKCLRVLTKRHYREKHSKAGVCKQIEVISKAVQNKSKKKTNVNRIHLSRKEDITEVIEVDKRSLWGLDEDNIRVEDTYVNIEKYTTKSSVFSKVLSLDEEFKQKFVGSLDDKFVRPIPENLDTDASCEYVKCDDKWVAVIPAPVVNVNKKAILKRKLKLKKKDMKVNTETTEC